MALPALGPLLASLLGTSTASGAAGAAGGAAAGAAAEAGTASVTRSLMQNAASAAAAGFNGGGTGGGGNPPIPPSWPAFGDEPDDFGDFNSSVRDAVDGLDRLYDGAQLAESALTRFSSGEVNAMKAPASFIIGNFESGVQDAISGKGLPTTVAQRSVDSAWNASGMGFVSDLPIIGILPSIFKDIVDAAINLPDAIEQWAESLLNNRFELARWNSQIAAIRVEAERREIIRDVASGANTAASTQALNAALQDLKDTMQPLNDTMINGFNRVTTGLLRLTNAAVNGAGDAAELAATAAKFVPLIGPAMYVIEKMAEAKRAVSGDDSAAVVEFLKRAGLEKPQNPPPGRKGKT